MMATVPDTQRGTGRVTDLPRVVHSTGLAAYHAYAARRDRDLTAFVGLPLAMLATGLVVMWWAWIPLVAASALAVRWRWSCLLTLQEGLVGTVWATAGLSYMREFPDEAVIVEGLWVVFPLLLALAGRRARVTMSKTGER